MRPTPLLLSACAATVIPIDAAVAQSQPSSRDGAALQDARERGSLLEAMRSPRIDALDAFLGRSHALRSNPSAATRAVDPTLGNPNPWAGLIDADDFHEGFETYNNHIRIDPATDPVTLDSNRVPLAGQTAPNGNTWGGAADFIGVVDNAVAQTGDNWNPTGTGFDRHGVEGGPDPDGLRANFFANPRGTVSEQPDRTAGGFFDGRLAHQFYSPTADEPLTIVIDMYLDDITTFVWWRPMSFTCGCIVTNIFMGGFDFNYFAPFISPENIVDRFIVLGHKPGTRSAGEFFGAAPGHTIAERQWFQVAVRLSVDSYSVWVRDSSTIGVNGFEQDSIFDGFPGDDTRGAFAGEIFAQDWLQFFPGVEDDPNTNAVEGNGTAHSTSNQEAEVFLDASGAPAGLPLFAGSVDAFQLMSGNDPHQETIPGFQPHDYYADNYTILGTPFEVPTLPPLQLPFVEDFEILQEGSVRYQGGPLNADFGAGSVIGSDQNHTPGGSQSVRQALTFADTLSRTVLRRDTLSTQARPGEPIDASFWMRFEGPRGARTAHAEDPVTGEAAFHLLFGALDAGGGADDRVYARLPNPNFDPGQPEDLLPGPFAQPINGANTRFVNAPLVDEGGLPITTPSDAWFQVRTIVEASGALRVFVGGVEAFPDGSVEGIGALTAAGGGFDSLEFRAAFEPAGVGSVVWIDDIAVDAKSRLRPDVLNAAQAPFDDDPPFGLPYIDGLETYGVAGSINDQGATPWLETLYTSINQVDILPLGAGQAVDEQTTGFFYTIDEVLYGEAPGGVGAGDRVFIVDNIPPALQPAAATVPGAPFSSSAPTLGVFRSDAAFPLATGQVEWSLENAEAQAWDGSTPVLGRFWAGFEKRWSAAAGQDQLVSDPTGDNRGTVLSLQSTFVASDAGTGDLDQLVGSLFPQARTDAGTDTIVTLAFDLWVAVDDPASGPRGRLAWDINGPGAAPGRIAQAVFGGPNNYLDELGIDLETGEILNGSDGRPDNFLRGQPLTVGGEDRLFADPTKLYVRRVNPLGGFGNPSTILEQTAYTVPGNTWIRCTAEITGEGDWTLSFDDGSTTFVVSGAAIDPVGDVSGTDGLDLSTGFDPGADGFAPTDPIAFTPLAPDAAPEGGLAPLDNPANVNGDFNDYVNPEYFYFEIREIFVPSSHGGVRPMIQAVDPVHGRLDSLREIRQDDIVVLWNDKSTQAFGGPAGERFAETIARHPQFMISEDGTTVTVRGTWTPLGLPGDAGILDPAPNGGIANAGPPYNSDIPFATILMGSVADFPPLAGEPLPGRAEWLVDAVRLDAAPPCPGNLVAGSPEAVDGADLGSLLGAWGTADAEADLNADGVVDGADLGMLLGAWGPCP